MTNREFYKEQILDIVCDGDSFAFNECKNEIMTCRGRHCKYCKFAREYPLRESCKECLREWCDQEYVEKPKLTENDKKFLDILSSDYEYIARDKDGKLYIYCGEKPTKNIQLNIWKGKSLSFRIYLSVFKITLTMVKWEDKEPWLIEDLRSLEVEKGE